MTKTDQIARMSYEHPVGSKEIAAALDVTEHTVHVWQQRKILPDPVDGWEVSGRPVWRLLVILLWALHTKRLDPFEATAKGAPLYGLVDTRCTRCRTGEGKTHSTGCSSKLAVISALTDLAARPRNPVD